MAVEKLARFEENRSRLFSLAYQMLGEAAEAEDVVQDAYLRWERSEVVGVPEAWLTKVVANLCLSRLTSARARRERYVGSWLPEPVLTASGPGPLEIVEQRDSVSFGMLLLLERLTPPERLAFVLREAFDYSHREVAEILQVDEVHARQLYHRARAHVGTGHKRFTAEPERGRRMVERFSPPPRTVTCRASNSCSPTTWWPGSTAAVGSAWRGGRSSAGPMSRGTWSAGPAIPGRRAWRLRSVRCTEGRPSLPGKRACCSASSFPSLSMTGSWPSYHRKPGQACLR
jgi:RNA polymerase sigma factor (sigma-70 family)